MADTVLEQSATSERTKTDGKDCTVGKFISEADGWKIIAIAATWEGTPYSMVGAKSEKLVAGDCSGTTNKIFNEAGFPYVYQSTGNFVAYANKTNRFRKIDVAKEKMQAGDILLWPGHMAIYAPFPPDHPKYDTGVIKGGKKKHNDMYTAFNSHTDKKYGPYNIETFRGDAYTVYRYYYLPTVEDCK